MFLWKPLHNYNYRPGLPTVSQSALQCAYCRHFQFTGLTLEKSPYTFENIQFHKTCLHAEHYWPLSALVSFLLETFWMNLRINSNTGNISTLTWNLHALLSPSKFFLIKKHDKMQCGVTLWRLSPSIINKFSATKQWVGCMPCWHYALCPQFSMKHCSK